MDTRTWLSTDHVIDFTVHGKNVEEIDQRARERVAEFFGDRPARLRIESRLLETLGGQVITWEGRVSARIDIAP